MPVLSEITTLTEICQGTSLARFGHGELAIMAGHDAAHQKFDPQLADELRAVLNSRRCLVAVPHARGRRSWEWRDFLARYGADIKSDRWYGSAFISRPDEVDFPPGYIEMARELVSRGTWLSTPGIDDYDRIDELERAAIATIRPPILLSCGPTATVLAHRLEKRNLWAVDLGNLKKVLG